MSKWDIEADNMCNVLVNEVTNTHTWSRMRDAIGAIQRVRTEERCHIVESEHLKDSSSMEPTAQDPLCLR